MIKTAFLTYIIIVNPNSDYKFQEVKTETIMIHAERQWDADNLCQRLGKVFVSESKANDKLARAYTCDGGSSVEWRLSSSFEKKETE